MLNPDVRRVVDTAIGIEGLKRQWGVHAAGVIMSSEPLLDVIPIMKREQDGAEERLLRAHPRARVRARKDRRSRLAAQLLEREPGVGQREEAPGPALDEVARQRPVLVEGGAAAARMLLEREGEVGALGQLAGQVGERAEAEAAQGRVELRRTDAHTPSYDLAGSGPFWHAGHQ